MVAAQAALDAEIIEERAGALGRAGRRLEKALARLVAFDAGAPLPPREDTEIRPAPSGRPTLVTEAREALWFLVVQREACGLRNTEEVLSAYGVPAEISLGVTLPLMAWRKQRGSRE